MNPEIIIQVRKNQPLIHHLTNQVVINFTANGLLAFGASPVMAKAEEEAEDMAGIADGVLINIGTLVKEDLKAMILAGKKANERGIPVVLDPVGIGATAYRKTAVEMILKEVRPTVIKGNAGELAHLANIPWQTKGVESVGKGNIQEITHKVAEIYKTAAVVTGETDYIFTGDSNFVNHTGHPLLTKVTGAGCLLGSILTACLTTEHKEEEQIRTAVTFYGLAAAYAASHEYVKGSGTFVPHFLDALSLTVKELEA